MTITSASFSDHKTTNTHENAPSLPKSHPDTRLLRRERESEGGKEGEKEAREGEEQLKRCVFFFLEVDSGVNPKKEREITSFSLDITATEDRNLSGVSGQASVRLSPGVGSTQQCRCFQ